jgi:hypothetical protein
MPKLKGTFVEDGWPLGFIVLMMESANTSETSVNLYQSAQRYNPEDSHLDTGRRENRK